MDWSCDLQFAKKKSTVVIIEEDDSTRKLIDAIVSSSFDEVEVFSFGCSNDLLGSSKLNKQNIDILFSSLRSFYKIRDQPALKAHLFKEIPTVVMASSLNKEDLDFLDSFYTEEPIILKKPFAINEIVNLAEWTLLTSNSKKEISNGFKKRKYNKNNSLNN